MKKAKETKDESETFQVKKSQREDVECPSGSVLVEYGVTVDLPNHVMNGLHSCNYVQSGVFTHKTVLTRPHQLPEAQDQHKGVGHDHPKQQQQALQRLQDYIDHMRPHIDPTKWPPGGLHRQEMELQISNLFAMIRAMPCVAN